MEAGAAPSQTNSSVLSSPPLFSSCSVQPCFSIKNIEGTSPVRRKAFFFSCIYPLSYQGRPTDTDVCTYIYTFTYAYACVHIFTHDDIRDVSALVWKWLFGSPIPNRASPHSVPCFFGVTQSWVVVVWLEQVDRKASRDETPLCTFNSQLFRKSEWERLSHVHCV